MESLSSVRNLKAEKAALIFKLTGFYNRSKRGGLQSLTLTDDEMAMIGTRRRDFTAERAKRVLEDRKFMYNPRRWYTIEWEEGKPPCLIITDYYLAPLLINVTRLPADPEAPKETYGYIAREMQIIVDKMMSP